MTLCQLYRLPSAKIWEDDYIYGELQRIEEVVGMA
jgi:hypothetical protein